MTSPTPTVGSNRDEARQIKADAWRKAAAQPALAAEIDRLNALNAELVAAIRFTLDLLDGLTSDRFAMGDDKPARDMMRAALNLKDD